MGGTRWPLSYRVFGRERWEAGGLRTCTRVALVLDQPPSSSPDRYRSSFLGASQDCRSLQRSPVASIGRIWTSTMPVTQSVDGKCDLQICCFAVKIYISCILYEMLSTH